jgi:hypothetical protein
MNHEHDLQERCGAPLAAWPRYGSRIRPPCSPSTGRVLEVGCGGKRGARPGVGAAGDVGQHASHSPAGVGEQGTVQRGILQSARGIARASVRVHGNMQDTHSRTPAANGRPAGLEGFRGGFGPSMFEFPARSRPGHEPADQVRADTPTVRESAGPTHPAIGPERGRPDPQQRVPGGGCSAEHSQDPLRYPDRSHGRRQVVSPAALRTVHQWPYRTDRTVAARITTLIVMSHALQVLWNVILSSAGSVRRS